jgi:hypothetical protein
MGCSFKQHFISFFSQPLNVVLRIACLNLAFAEYKSIDNCSLVLGVTK